MHFLGIAGNPRRYSEFTDFELPEALMPLHTFITHAAYHHHRRAVHLSGQPVLEPEKGPKAPANPWEATTLEWTMPSPPPHDNFGGQDPVVNHGPYEYSVPGAAKDYVMQNDPA